MGGWIDHQPQSACWHVHHGTWYVPHARPCRAHSRLTFRSFARFRSTRAVLDSTSTETGRRKIIREYREANERANGGREREDLYTDNWDGDVYKGSPVNVLSVILAVSILAPLVGLIFALQTHGTLWG